MKKFLTLILAVAMVLALAAPAMAEDTTIVMIGQQLGNVVFLDAEKGMNDAGADLGVTVEWQSPLRAEAELQNEIMLNLISRGDVDGIAISCTTGDALMASINAALDAGIQVVCYDVDSPNSNREYYIGTENYKAGYTSGEYMIDLYKDIDLVVNKKHTAVEEIAAGKTVASVAYYNLAGQQSRQPVDGVNIIVTTYTDGTRSTAKVVK